MMTTWTWMADAVLAVLLAATLVMAVRLDRALRVVRRDRTSFETLISNLGAATGSVKAGIQALRAEAERAAEQIEHRSTEAGKMATDLSFLVEAADRAGARLEQTLQSMARPEAGYAAEPGPAHGAAQGKAQVETRVAETKAAAATSRRRPRKITPKAATGSASTASQETEAANRPETETMSGTGYEDGRGATQQTAASDAELRARAGITTRGRAPRNETGAALIKLVG